MIYRNENFVESHCAVSSVEICDGSVISVVSVLRVVLVGVEQDVVLRISCYGRDYLREDLVICQAGVLLFLVGNHIAN